MTGKSESEKHLWFLNTLVKIRVSESEGEDRISVLEHHAPAGDSPPLHIHHTEDEILQVLEGEFRFVIDKQERQLSAGEFLLAPKGVPHQYLVESKKGGRWLTITTPGDFERFVQATARPAERRELPAPAGPPTPEVAKLLTETAAKYGIEIIGQPLH